MNTTKTHTPKEKAEQLVWHFYSKLEHTFNDEYSKYDWNISIRCAMDVVDFIEGFMREDDDISDTCHYANSHWTNYWIEVRKKLNAMYNEDIVYKTYCKEFDKENPPFSAPYPKKLTKIEFFENLNKK